MGTKKWGMLNGNMKWETQRMESVRNRETEIWNLELRKLKSMWRNGDGEMRMGKTEIGSKKWGTEKWETPIGK
ncbi:hypothetical protein TNCV_2938701 [Trichonephila clavipes]|nr:hypothetical protein TNCV_2938701 [Trichonephila clavipes]